MRILITGAMSGLGRHIYETLGGIPWTRELMAEDRERIKRGGVDVIIHCAFNSRQAIDSDCLYDYLNDNVLLTKELTSIPHHKFIFISTVDVYPKRPGFHSENEIIDVNAVNGIYGLIKLMSEAVVKEHCSNHLILRCVTLLGKYSRKNSLIKMIEDSPCTLSLSGKSRFNYILHSDVSDFIQFAIKDDIYGTYNVSSSENIVLSKIADMLGKQINFGEYRYDVGDISNKKIVLIFPAFNKTSREVVKKFNSRVFGNR